MNSRPFYAALVDRWSVPLLILADVIAMLWLSSRLNAWVDEAYSFHTTSGSLTYAIHQSVFWELQPPAYFIALWSWRHLGASVFTARLFSIACVAATLWVSAAIARRVAGSIRPAWLVLALAVNTLIVGVAVEIRVYALILLLSSLLVLLFLDGYVLDGRRKPWTRVAYVACAALALYTQYYLGFLLAAHAVVLLGSRRWPALRDYVLGMVAAAVLAIPVVSFLKYQIASNSVNYSEHLSVPAGIVSWAKLMAIAVLSIDWLPSKGKFAVIGLCVVGALFVAWLARRQTRDVGAVGFSRPEVQPFVPLITIVAGGVLFATAVSLAHQEITSRYSAGLLLPAFFAIYAGIAALPRGLRGWTLALWTALIVATSVVSLYATYRPMAKLGDWIRVAAFIQAHEQAGQPIVVFDSQSSLPLALYYHGPNAIVPLPRPMDFTRYDLRTVALSDPAQVRNAFLQSPGSRPSYWLVTSDSCRRAPVNFRCEILDGFIARHFDVQIDEAFYKSHVRLLLRKPGTSL